MLIVEHRLGFVMANAGVDQSNVARAGGRELALLLPVDPDASAARLRGRLRARDRAANVGVVINDSFGRPWRLGTVGVAIGVAPGCRRCSTSAASPTCSAARCRSRWSRFADEIAAAASLLMGQADEARPVIVVRGLHRREPQLPAAALLRPPGEDLFR